MTLPWLTSGVPSCGATFTATSDTFAVDEVPAYEPSGEGEHLFVHIRKRNLSTPELRRRLCAHAGIPESDVGWAGLKDASAVTTQWLSLPRRAAAAVETFTDANAEVLAAKFHGNKLRIGHLRGNHFRMRLDQPTRADALRACLEQLGAEGLPNYFEAQRFGRDGRNAERGLHLLRNNGRRGDHFSAKLWLSALQSSLFNEVLAERLRRQSVSQALVGDVLKKYDSGGEFLCGDTAVDGPRVKAFEVGPTGPMFGPKMRAPEGIPAEIEQAVLQRHGLSAAAFRATKRFTAGARRFLRVQVSNIRIADAANGHVWIEFTLPAGSYATSVTAELLKTPHVQSSVQTTPAPIETAPNAAVPPAGAQEDDRASESEIDENLEL